MPSQAGLQTHLLHLSPQTVTSDSKSRQTKANKVKNHKSDDWHEFAVLLCKPSGCGQVASGYGWHEQIDLIAEESTRTR